MSGPTPSGGGSQTLQGSDAVATVNSEPITVSQFYSTLQHYVPASVPGFPQNPALNAPAGRVALQELIISSLTLQLAKQNGVPVTQDELNTSFNDNKMLSDSHSTMPYQQIVQREGYTLNEYKQYVLAPDVATTNLLSKMVAVTPQELQATYKANLKTSYTISAAVHVRRVVCANKAQAQTVYNSVKSGQPMSRFASLNVGAPPPPSAGDPTDFPQWVNVDHLAPSLAPLSAPLKTAKSGQLLAPILVQGQWWVLQVIEARPQQELPFNDVQDLVRLNLVRQKAGPNASAQIQNLLLQDMQRADIKINPPQYRDLGIQIHDYSMLSTRMSAPGRSAPQQPSPPGHAAPSPMVVPSAPAPGTAPGKPVAPGSANQPH